MILFGPKINVAIDKVIRDKNGRYILSEALLDDVKFTLVNICMPRMIGKFISSETFPIPCSIVYTNETLVVGGEFNYA